MRHADSFIQKVESLYKHSFSKNQDSGFLLPSTDSSDHVEDIQINSVTNNVALHDSDVNERITHVMNLSDEDYEDVWDMLSPYIIITPKVTIDTKLLGNHYL